MDVDDGPGTDLRTVLEVFFVGGSSTVSGLFPAGTGNEDGRPSSFNDSGQLTFGALFTDGTSGVFVSNLVAVPEPSATVLLALGALGVLGLGRGRRARRK